uniref:DUF7455 domain-containing protein n=1 Tax=Microbacterium proteolyticum TaxID=1572644 RepID=UPI0024162C49|nr:hypothetical protein [Microbacterium proteolyticum]
MDEYVSCDQCSARAYIFVELANGGELSWCIHHGKHHTPALQAAGAIIFDLSYTLE